MVYVHNINPVLLKLGFFELRYYSLAYMLGAVIVYLLIKKIVKDKNLKIDNSILSSLFLTILAGILIGARIGYVLFYNLTFYLKNPLEVLALWHGGMSFHGGLIGSFIAAYLFCKKHRLNFWQIADISVIPVGIALFFGRLANFINAELYGRITTIPWAVKFPNVEGYRHPSQLYEALKNLVIFVVLWSMKDKKFKHGFLFWLFVLMYGLLRFTIEFFRAPDFQIGLILNLTLGQWFCLVMVLLSSFMLIRLRHNKP